MVDQMGVVWEGTRERCVEEGEDDVDEVRVGVELVTQGLDDVITTIRNGAYRLVQWRELRGTRWGSG